MKDIRPERLMYENTERWDKDVPTDLIPAIKHLRRSFDDAHWGCGRTTELFCYSLLHSESIDDPRKEYINYLMHMKVRVGQAATHRFHELAKEGTLPALFKAFFDLYLEGMSVQALLIFKELVEIGRANENRLAIPYLEWAEAQTRHLIRSDSHHITIWVRNVCDKHVYDPNEDMEEKVFWRKWQAPLFLIMTPSLYTPYDAAAVWGREDAESSSNLLQHFADHYVLHLEVKLKKAAGVQALELAKKPIPTQTGATDVDLTRLNLSNSTGMIRQQTGDVPGPAKSVRREARKLDTRAVHESWRREYRKLKRNRPSMSDVWYSQQLSKLAIANGRSAETIRKHMTT
jgi:hypothetical protein